MKKFLKTWRVEICCSFAMIVMLAVTVGLTIVQRRQASVPVDVVVARRAVGNRPLVPCMAFLETEETDDAWFILVDLNDRINYPHALENRIILKSLRVSGNLSDAIEWNMTVGIVTAVTTATTDIEWVWGANLQRAMFFDERWQLPEHGLSLLVTGGSLENVATFETASTAVITSGTEISTTVGVTGTVEVGDLIMFTDAVTTTSTLNLDVNVGYATE